MNETQWLFELETFVINEEQRYEDVSLMAKAAKRAAIQLLGLNILPVEDKDTGRLRPREDHEVIPLLAAICREDIAMEVKNRIEDMQAQDLVQSDLEREQRGEAQPMTAEEMDAFMNSDIDFTDTAEVKRLSVINSPGYDYISKHVIETLSAEDRQKYEEVFGFAPEAAPEALQSVLPKDVPKDELRIESETVAMPKKRRLNIKIEAE